MDTLKSLLFSTMFLDFTFVVIVCHVDPDAVPEEMAALVMSIIGQLTIMALRWHNDFLSKYGFIYKNRIFIEQQGTLSKQINVWPFQVDYIEPGNKEVMQNKICTVIFV